MPWKKSEHCEGVELVKNTGTHWAQEEVVGKVCRETEAERISGRKQGMDLMAPSEERESGFPYRPT